MKHSRDLRLARVPGSLRSNNVVPRDAVSERRASLALSDCRPRFGSATDRQIVLRFRLRGGSGDLASDVSHGRVVPVANG